jgi:hypothetical protein
MEKMDYSDLTTIQTMGIFTPTRIVIDYEFADKLLHPVAEVGLAQRHVDWKHRVFRGSSEGAKFPQTRVSALSRSQS